MLSFRGILASLFGLSNIYYYKQSLDYFGALADLNLTHTWSLGVEEQFYLILPFIFVYFLRSSLLSRFLLFILSSLFTLSFILFIAISFTDQPASYFLPQYRAFTFLAGSILYVISLRSKTIFPSYSNIYSSISLILIFTMFFTL